MEIYSKSSVLKQIKKIPFQDRKKIFKKISYLPTEPRAGKALKGDFAGTYSLRSWPYRIIYEIGDKRIIILSIAHRQGVYN